MKRKSRINNFFLFCVRSYNAIKAYSKEGRQTELSAGEHLVSAATAGQYSLNVSHSSGHINQVNLTMAIENTFGSHFTPGTTNCMSNVLKITI